MQGTYVRSRDAFLGRVFAAARASDAAAVLVWEIMPWRVANQSYDFRCTLAPSPFHPRATSLQSWRTPAPAACCGISSAACIY